MQLQHTVLQPILDFLLEPGMSLVQGVHKDPIWLEFEIGEILEWGPSEIQAPGTPGVSHGTNFLVSKFLSYHENMMLFYAFLPFIMQKSEFI